MIARPLALLSLMLLTLLAIPAFAQDGTEHLQDGRSLYQAGHWDDANQAFQEAYDQSSPTSETRAAAALEWGSLLWEQGSYRRAEELVRESLNLARQLDLDAATGQLLVTLGHIEAARGNLTQAENTLNLCVQLTGELGDSIHRALCRMNRRVVRTLRGQNPGSDSDFRADIQTLQSADTPLAVGTSLAKTAQLYMEHHDLERAETLLNEAQSAFQRAGSVPALARNRLRLVQLLHRQGRFDDARPRLVGLKSQFESMRNRPMQIQVLALQAEAAHHLNHPSQALAYYRQAIELANSINDPQLTGRTHLAICEMEVQSSPVHCARAIDLFRQFQMPFLEIRALSGQGRVLQRSGQRQQALDQYTAALTRLEETVSIDGPHRLTKGLLLANACQVHAQLNLEESFQSCAQALELIHTQDTDTIARYESLRAAVHYNTGRAAIATNRGTTALNHLEEAARLYLKLSPPQPLMAADVLLRRGIVQANAASERPLAQGTFEEALQHLADLTDSPDVLRIRVSLLNQLAQLHLGEENWSTALTRLQELQAAANQASDPRSEAWAHSASARALLRLDRPGDAQRALETALPLAQQSGDTNLTDSITRNLARFD